MEGPSNPIIIYYRFSGSAHSKSERSIGRAHKHTTNQIINLTLLAL